MNVFIIPLMGALHLRYPSYNAVTVRDLLAACEPDAVAVSALSENALDQPRWQDTAELVLPLTVIPWVKRQSLAFHLVHEPSPDETALDDFRRFASEYPQLGQKMSEVEVLLRPLQSLLGETLSLRRILDEVLPVVKDYQAYREELFEDGPATDWARKRAGKMAEKVIALDAERVVVLASIDHIPFLGDALKDKVELTPLPDIEISAASRERSILDFAFRSDVPEPGNLIAKLRDLVSPEARYHEANLLFVNAHEAEALELLETTSKGDFSEPYYLPGYLLSRLGQLYDLAGDRKAALRSYRGVLALDYAPLEALDAANAGLEQAFSLSVEPAS